MEQGMRKRIKEEGEMEKLTIAALLIIALSTGAVAHQGSIGLFTDMSASDCDETLIPFLGYEITIVYFKSDAGPSGIFAAQFKLEVPPDDVVLIQGFTPSPDIVITEGHIASGLSCAFANCSGGSEDYLFIGTVEVVAVVAIPMTFRIVTAENINPANPPVAVRVAMCDAAHTKVAVLGGWFSTPDGTCNTGTEETTWGAIKEMYKD